MIGLDVLLAVASATDQDLSRFSDLLYREEHSGAHGSHESGVLRTLEGIVSREIVAREDAAGDPTLRTDGQSC